MPDITVRMKRLYGKGEFGPEFIEAAKEDLPRVWGRMSLLEEYYNLAVYGGPPERMANLRGQLDAPLRFHGNPLRKLLAAITG